MTLPQPTGMRLLPRSPYCLSSEGESRLAVASYFVLPPFYEARRHLGSRSLTTRPCRNHASPQGAGASPADAYPTPAPSPCQPDLCAASAGRYDGRHALIPWEEERLLIFAAAELARRHRAAGQPLNPPGGGRAHLRCDARGGPGRRELRGGRGRRSRRRAAGRGPWTGSRRSSTRSASRCCSATASRLVVLPDPLGTATPPNRSSPLRSASPRKQPPTRSRTANAADQRPNGSRASSASLRTTRSNG